MLHELTITVDDTVYRRLKPMVEQQTIGIFLHDFLQNRLRNVQDRPIPAISGLRGTLHSIDTSDLRDEVDRTL